MLSLEKITKEKIVLFDAETDGLNLRFSRPWQLSWLVMDGGKIQKQEDRFPWFPDIKVSKEAAFVNRFEFDKYKDKAEDKAKVLQDFERDSKGAWLAGHNILNFDVFILNNLKKSCGVEQSYPYMDKVIDTRAFAIALQLGATNIDFDNFTAWQYSMLSIRKRGLKSSLGFLLKELGIPHDPSKLHDGLYDIEMNAELLKQIVYKFK